MTSNAHWWLVRATRLLFLRTVREPPGGSSGSCTTCLLSRWDEEKAALISDGHDKISNSNLSILLSLLSPKLKFVPHSEELLSLFSMLPEGLGNIELIQSKPPIGDILSCKTTLIRTALAYFDERKRMEALVSIREYMQRNRPPGNHLIGSLLKYFQALHSRAPQGILRVLGQLGTESERHVHLHSGSPQA
jgi:hypothetical protein